MSDNNISDSDLIQRGRRVLAVEAQALLTLQKRIDASFIQACEYLLACRGRTVVLGIGKSGHIGNKIAATLASTGTPAFFVHPAEASHGDLGMITAQDVVIVLSNSGETEELLTIIPLLKHLGVIIIALTGNVNSRLAQAAHAHLDISVEQEACPLNLAPTASSTATLAMGDALAVALLDARGFSADDFARSHPGGRLGRRLLVRIADVMHTGSRIPSNHPDDTLEAALLEMTSKGLGMTVIVDNENKVLGVFTDGDLRRALEQRPDIHRIRIDTLMTAPCKTVTAQQLAVDAIELMETYKITMLPVVDDDDKLTGAFHLHDLLQAGVV